MKKIFLFLVPMAAMATATTVILALVLSPAAWGFNIDDDYLKGVSGARAIGMAGAFGALADTPDAAAWNPAGLAALDRNVGLTGHWSNYWGEASIYGLSGSIPVPTGVAGFNYLQEKTANIPQTIEDENGRPEILGYFYNSKTAVNFSYAFSPFENVAAGLNAKFFTHTIASSSAKGSGVDLGFLYKGSEASKTIIPCNIGFTLYNLVSPKLTWPTGHTDYFARYFSFSLAYPFLWGETKTNLAAEFIYSSKQTKLLIGAEFWPVEIMAGRIGFNENGLTLGLGLKLEDKFSLDVAYYNHPDLGANYQLTITWFIPKL